MLHRDGQGYIEQTRFNCDRKWDAEGVRDFAEAPVNTVTVEFDLRSEAYSRRCR